MSSFNPYYNIKRSSNRSIKKLLTSNNKTKKKFSDIKHFIDEKNSEILNIDKNRKEISKLLIDNIVKYKKINPVKIIPPRQCSSNCWFNVLFMMHFISDKGRKFFKPLRLLMINGNYDTNLVQTTDIKRFKKALFLFNIAIDSVLTGSSFSNNMDTKKLIMYIYDSIKVKKSWVKKKVEFGNSLDYFLSLMKLIYKKEFFNFIILNKVIDINSSMILPNTITLSYLPELIIIELYDDSSKKINNKKNILTVNYDNKKYNYILDSICLRDVTQEHVGCYITLNKAGYFFDGDSTNRIKKINWKTNKFLNTKKNITFGNINADFNIRSGYQILYYFRNN